jgi:hypothetical protein
VLITVQAKNKIGIKNERIKLRRLPKMVMTVISTQEKYIRYLQPTLLKQAIMMTPSRAITASPRTAPKKPRKAVLM